MSYTRSQKKSFSRYRITLASLLFSALFISGCNKASEQHSQQNAVDSSSSKTIGDDTANNTRYLPDCAAQNLTDSTMPKALSYRVISKYRHDPKAFTQGLVYQNGLLFESTGLYGQSSLRVQKLGDASSTQTRRLDDTLFGEGLTLLNDQLIQLTWKSGRVFRYRASDFSPLQEAQIDGQGWGISDNGEILITSDGSATLTRRDVESLEAIGSVTATFAGRPLTKINELEWIGNCLFANIWLSDTITIIDVESGKTQFTLDIASLAFAERQGNRDHVANGIAYRDDSQTLLVTGKNWHWIYELELLEPTPKDS